MLQVFCEKLGVYYSLIYAGRSIEVISSTLHSCSFLSVKRATKNDSHSYTFISQSTISGFACLFVSLSLPKWGSRWLSMKSLTLHLHIPCPINDWNIVLPLGDYQKHTCEDNSNGQVELWVLSSNSTEMFQRVHNFIKKWALHLEQWIKGKTQEVSQMWDTGQMKYGIEGEYVSKGHL